MIEQRPLDSRLIELTLSTPALAAQTHVRVLLPRGYDPAARRRYPVLYLLHGGNGDYTDWTKPGKGDAAEPTADVPLIVVMPDAGRGGWYTDWFNNGSGGQPMWETYHVGQLIPFVDSHFRTIAARRGRAILGLSMGGFGAMSYAARHPDTFVAAGALSGAVDTNTPPGVAPPLLDAISGLDGGVPGSLWGPRATEEVRWRGHNPWDLATNLHGLQLTVRTGNGQAGGPYGEGGPTDVLEPLVHMQSVSFHERLGQLGIPHVWDDYGPGGHAWPYWNRGLRQTLPLFMRAFAKPPAPARVTYTSIDPTYSAYGWRVALDRPVLEFSTLEHAARSGFELSGSGSGRVTTPALFKPRTLYRLRVATGGRVTQVRRRADGRGRLSVVVSLGPASAVQQYSPQAAAGGSAARATSVTIRREPPRP